MHERTPRILLVDDEEKILKRLGIADPYKVAV